MSGRPDVTTVDVPKVISFVDALCFLCRRPMTLSKGQQARYHKACRTEGRRVERSLLKGKRLAHVIH